MKGGGCTGDCLIPYMLEKPIVVILNIESSNSSLQVLSLQMNPTHASCLPLGKRPNGCCTATFISVAVAILVELESNLYSASFALDLVFLPQQETHWAQRNRNRGIGKEEVCRVCKYIDIATQSNEAAMHGMMPLWYSLQV
jgi:hypothetical protein